MIERQVRHLTGLVDDLLDVSRIARGKVELKEELVELAEVVAKAIEMTSPLLEQRMHTLELHVARSGLPIRGDATRLSQVTSNLLTNAAKYTPAGGHLTVRGSEEEGQVVLRVRDTGIGIAADVLPRVFDLFVQERQALDRSQGGLGLGLTIVRNFVEHHSGSVSASSQGPGSGSEFVVRLPKAAVAHASQEARVVDVRECLRVPTSAQALRVMVVDDNADAGGAVARDPRFAENEAHRCHRNGQESDRRKTRQAGFDHHLVKPVDLRAVDEVLTHMAVENTGLEERESLQ